MYFNSLNYAVFLPLVFIIYWYLGKKSLTLQNGFLLISSYFFYSYWDWRFLFLLIFSTFLDFYTGIEIYESKTKKNKLFWLWLSITINLGLLGVFKYYNFFASSFSGMFSAFGLEISPFTLKIILPVGISFYTFHGLSYIIDIYKNRITPEKNIINYSVFVCFFPLLVAGPIERATHLLPQVKSKRVFNYTQSADGLRQILWGLFKKIVIADQCAELANAVFNNHLAYSNLGLIAGAVFFTVQIYCDFSGYSDIAIGSAKLLGIKLLNNFSFPYFSRNIAEFWRRWHISLSSWFKDYLYIPLGGSKGNIGLKIRNTIIIFLVSGFWHGANWTFLVWGLLNAFYILPSIIFKSNRKYTDVVAKGKILPTSKELFQISFTFGLTVFAWIFFRAENLEQAFQFIKGIFTHHTYSILFPPISKIDFFILVILLFFFFIIEWFGREEQFAIAKLGFHWNSLFRYTIYFLMIFALFWFGGKAQQFIYFEF